MFNSTSVKLRLAFAVGSNTLRAMISFITGLIIARILTPAGYGDFTFLLGSFVAIHSLLDMGSSSAFFTFLSNRARGRRFYLAYFSWLVSKFIAILALLGLIIPAGLFEKIWLGHNREIVILAFVAAFMQQQVWETVGQIGEAMRKTVKVQLMNLAVAQIYLMSILFLSIYARLSVEIILLVLIVQYVAATLFAHHFLMDNESFPHIDESSLRETLRDYWRYCKPLVALAFVSFAYTFADKWMLQKYGGAAQQGYFQIASQFAAVSLLATTSILKIFWKEIADAWGKKDRARVKMLYHRVNRGLVMLGAIIGGLLIPWAEQIVNIFLGAAYVQAWPVLAIMLLYPIHQSMGQIGGTMFLASGQTRSYMFVSICTMTLSIPVTYFVLAPPSNMWLSGMELGAFGLACKMVALGIVSVNIQAWIIARHGGWKFDWVFQAVGIPMMIVAGYVAKMLADLLWDMKDVSAINLLVPALVASCFYLLIVIVIVLSFPWLIGVSRGEIEGLFGRILHRKA